MRSVEKMKKEIDEFEKFIESRREGIRCQEEFMKQYPNIPTDDIRKTIFTYEDEIKRAESHIKKLQACIINEDLKNREGD